MSQVRDLEVLGLARDYGIAADLVREELIPVPAALGEFLGAPGLRRGSTVVLQGVLGSGATSFALALLAGATTGGIWCAAVNLPALGLVAANELGVALDHLVLVPSPQQRLAGVVATLLDGCGVVLVAWPGRVGSAEARRLASRARERRCALIVLLPSTEVSRSSPLHWPEPPDVAVLFAPGRFSGIGHGVGRITAHLVEATATRRRVTPREIQAHLWLPSPKGMIELVDHEPVSTLVAGGERAVGGAG